MRLIFKKVVLHNFLSFADAEVNLNNQGYVFVKGVNNNPDDLAQSNGSGKSSLFEAINWCLCGETIRGAKDVTRIGEKNCYVEVTCTIDKDEYVITRYRDPSNLKIVVNGVDKSGKGIKDSEKLLSQYLPDLTNSLLGSVVILGQGLPQRFSNNTPSGRKEVLEKLSKSDFMIDDLRTRISERKTKLQADIRSVEDDILKLNTSLDIHTKNIETAKAQLEVAVKPNETEIALLQETADNTGRLIDDGIAKVTELTTILNKSNEIQVKLVTDKTDKINAIRTAYEPELNKFNKLHDELFAERTALTAEIKKLESITDVCPTCGQKLIGVEKPSTETQYAHLHELNDKIDSIETELNNTKAAMELDITKVENEFNSSIEIERQQYALTKNQLDETNTALISNRLTLSNISTSLEVQKKLLAEYDTVIAGLNNTIKVSEDEIAQLNEKMLYNNNYKENLSQHFDVVNKMSTLITRDFRGYLLINIIEYINQKAKEYSMSIFETDKIDFILDGNNINISYDGKDYPNLSGGEKQKVDVIVQFAIRDMLCNYLDFSSNILVLDEISDNIDSVGAERLFNTISQKLADIESIFIVSHHVDFEIPYDSDLIVMKGEDKISRIV